MKDSKFYSTGGIVKSPYVFSSQIPTTVGYYMVDSFVRISITKKPSWFHRKMIELTLGWKWEDVK
jgi:hypothetical protein